MATGDEVRVTVAAPVPFVAATSQSVRVEPNVAVTAV